MSKDVGIRDEVSKDVGIRDEVSRDQCADMG